MRQHAQVQTYEDTVDALQVYRPAVSQQEIGETLYHMYSRVGPVPAKKYFGVVTAVIGTRTKTSGCQVSGALEDKACTPGAVIATATKDTICTSGYAASVRNVSDGTKNAVYAEYGIASHVSGQYEVDHLISLELGGSNDIANLWPEAASPTPGFHQKDVAENELHDKVCAGVISLSAAQSEIATNWLALYAPVVTKAPTISPSAPAAAPSPTPSPPSSSGRTGAICKDGTTSSATGSGACSHHNGVERWLY